MTLQVPFEQFIPTVKRVLGVREAYVTSHLGGSLVTSGTSTARALVASVSSQPTEVVRTSLKDAGIDVYEGAWSHEGLIDFGDPCFQDTYVVAVSYDSSDGRPGLWVDGFPTQPSQVHVLRAMYDEFRGTGEIASVSFEEFVRLANANVIIVTPAQLRGYVAGKTSVLPTVS